MLKTGRKTTWEDIEINEVFAEKWEGEDFGVLVRVSKKEALRVAGCWDIQEEEHFPVEMCQYSIYKLPKAVQLLWRCDE